MGVGTTDELMGAILRVFVCNTTLSLGLDAILGVFMRDTTFSLGLGAILSVLARDAMLR